MQKILSRKKTLSCSFLLPFLLQIVVFAALKITPFGNKGLLFGDASCYFLKEFLLFREQIVGNRSFLYSFVNGLGSSSAYSLTYLLSPYSWIMLLAGGDHIELCFAVAVIFVTSAYGLSMMLLLCDVWEPRLSNIIFSTCYALMAYNVVYNYCVVFFCGPLFLPLMVLGLRKIFRGESGLLYAISIAYCVAYSIQTGLIICETSVLFFAVKFLADQDIDRKRVATRYALFSAVGGVLPAAIWLPTLLSMLGARASQNGLSDFTFDDNAPILAMLSRLFSGAASVNQIVNGLPAIFCGILTVILVIMFFIDENNPKRRKAEFGAIIGALILTFYIRFFSTIVHGSHTNYFNYRNSFVFSFVLILIAACEFERILEVSERVIRVSLIILAASTILIFSQRYEHIIGGNVVLDLALLAVMMAGLFFLRKHPEKGSITTLTLIFLVCTCLQLYVNYYVSMHRMYEGVWKDVILSVSDFQDIINKKLPHIQAITGADTSFYRMEGDYTLTDADAGNDAGVFNYNGIGQASLYTDKEIMTNEAKFGISYTNQMWCYYDAGMPASMESLLGLKYIISPRDLETSNNYKRLLQGLYPDVGDIYQNPYALSIASLSDEGITKADVSKEKNVFEVQNIVWKGLTGGSRDLFTEERDVKLSMHNPTDDISFDQKEMLGLPDLNVTSKSDEDKAAENKTSEEADKLGMAEKNPAVRKSGSELAPEDYLYKSYIEYEFTAKKTGPVYLYDSAAFMEGVGTTEDILQYVGYFHEGDKVVGRLVVDYTLTSAVFVSTGQGLHIAYADMDTLVEYAELLNSRDVTIEKIIDHHLTGTVNAAESQRLFFTIPYQKGWTLWVDGIEQPLEKTCDLFMSAAVTPGEHVYELKFWPPGLTVGIIVSLIALVGLVGLCGYDLKHKIVNN